MSKKRKSRKREYIYKKRITIGPPRLTSFERARIIGVRAVQLDYGALPFIDVKPNMSTIEIAKKELETGELPLSIRRRLFFRGDYPPIPVKWLLEAEREDLKVDL